MHVQSRRRGSAPRGSATGGCWRWTTTPIKRQLVATTFRKTPEIDVVPVADGETALCDRQPRPARRRAAWILSIAGIGGLELLQKLKLVLPRVPIVVITATADGRAAVEAIRLGAYQFLTKPVNPQELLVIVKRALERTELLAELESLRHRADGDDPLAARFGVSPPMQLVARQIRQVAASQFTVLVQGETGVGKEVVARAIHELSPRAEGPFVAIDCGAIPENLLESELFGHEKGAFSGADRRKDGLLQVAHAGTLAGRRDRQPAARDAGQAAARAAGAPGAAARIDDAAQARRAVHLRDQRLAGRGGKSRCSPRLSPHRPARECYHRSALKKSTTPSQTRISPATVVG